KSKSEIDALANAAINGTTIEKNQQKWSFEEISNMEFRVVLNSNCYSIDEKTELYTDLRNTQTGLKYLYDNGTVLKVSGIIRPKEDTVTPMLNGTVGYTHKLTEYIIENSADSSAIQEQLKNKSIDIFTGLPFHENTGNLDTEQKVSEFRNYISLLDESSRAETYVKIMSVPQKSELDAMVSDAVKNSSSADIETAVTEMLIIQMGMSDNDVKTYIKSMSEEDITAIYTEMVTEQIKTEYETTVQNELKNSSQTQLSAGLDKAMSEYSSEHIAVLYDEILVFSESTCEDNLRKLGHVNLEAPATVNLYASTFENKEVIEDAIADYNKNKDEFQKITYTDYVGLMMSSVTSIINAITYVLIAFVAISLIVSSIMIGVITLISVQERTKEIGILRAIGASKINVSRMFNAETIIIGLISGILGIAVTYLLCIPINIIMHNITGIGNLNAFLPPEVAVVLICISVLLTTVSGIIPSRSAAKKDPVVALRSE
ncbi:MAG: ABC transporter permease, partial [Oscillospiraceae bacterium]|nr:ABC transporter permease [Oscillospiraceae bacterium]